MTTAENTAPFIITHHDDVGEWYGSPVLRSLITFTVVVRTKDGSVYEGEVASINEDETITLTNASEANAWTTISIHLLHISSIHYT